MHYAPGAILVRQGDLSKDVYYVVRGTLRVIENMETPTEHVIRCVALRTLDTKR